MAVHESGDPLVTITVIDAMEIAENSFEDYYLRAGTRCIMCVTVSGKPQAGVQTHEIATVTGAIEVMRFWSFFYDNSVVTTSPTKLFFDLYDQTNDVKITADGVDCSGVSLHALLGRLDQNGVIAHLMDTDQVRIVDGAVGLDLFAPFIVNAKNGADTRVRLNYTTDGGWVDFVLCYEIIWRPLVRDLGRLRIYYDY